MKKCVIATLAALVLSGCSSSDDKTLTIMAAPLPHAEILRYVESHFDDAPKLNIIEIDGQTDPNQPLAGGDIDANYFQHRPFLEEDLKHLSASLTVVADVHIEPLGIYSSKYDSLTALPDGARIALPNNPTNLARSLLLLQDNGLLKVKGSQGQAITEQDITANPHHLRLVLTDSPLITRALPDVDAGIINGNFALEAGLTPSKDALALEPAAHNPYANILVVRDSDKNDPRVKKLAEELTSPDVAAFIEQHYRGSVLPVHHGGAEQQGN
ncbi:MetQ/NlpA family ABC transporter substrate-binding protein [Carnimonas bestiolae]|uniref:MetQ/NlpA family ABC transporter substrate-binding protein n=1 Tax=Carnimonas bestiolae TaxID=3402172 RepID=UPI003EDBBD54